MGWGKVKWPEKNWLVFDKINDVLWNSLIDKWTLKISLILDYSMIFGEYTKVTQQLKVCTIWYWDKQCEEGLKKKKEK